MHASSPYLRLYRTHKLLHCYVAGRLQGTSVCLASSDPCFGTSVVATRCPINLQEVWNLRFVLLAPLFLTTFHFRNPLPSNKIASTRLVQSPPAFHSPIPSTGHRSACVQDIRIFRPKFPFLHLEKRISIRDSTLDAESPSENTHVDIFCTYLITITYTQAVSALPLDKKLPRENGFLNQPRFLPSISYILYLRMPM